MSTARAPFFDILRRSLRWGAFGGLAVYIYAIATDNPSLYTSKASTKTLMDGDACVYFNIGILDHGVNLNGLNYEQLSHVYREEVKKALEEDPVSTKLIIEKASAGPHNT